MIRRAAAVALAFALYPALVCAQDSVFTVSASSADVYKGPSNVTPIVGNAPRGTVLPIARNLGSWVKVPWPAAPDGVGYVRIALGQIGPPSGNAMANGTSGSAPAARTTSIPPMTRTSVGEQAAPRGLLHVTPASHVFGIGAVAASANRFGASARAWRGNRIGIQFGATRDAATSALAPGRVTTMRFEPGVVYGLFDRVGDYLWIRPYVGSAAIFGRQTLDLAAPLPVASSSETTKGFRVFGGSELTFASAPRFGLSVDVGVGKFEAPFAGFESRRLGGAVAGHWYVK